MIHSLRGALTPLTLAFVLTGCSGTARVYHQTQNSATFVLEGVEDKALKDAHKKIAAQCGARGYHLVERSTVVVGQENYSDEQKDYSEQDTTVTDREAIATQDGDSDHEFSGGGSSREQELSNNGPGYDDRVAASESEYSGGGSESYSDVQQNSEHEHSTRDTDGSERTQTVEGTRDVNERRITFQCGPAPQ